MGRCVAWLRMRSNVKVRGRLSSTAGDHLDSQLLNKKSKRGFEQRSVEPRPMKSLRFRKQEAVFQNGHMVSPPPPPTVHSFFYFILFVSTLHVLSQTNLPIGLLHLSVIH